MLYSVGYMDHDEDVARFFAVMNFFIFSMLLLVLAATCLSSLLAGKALALLRICLLAFGIKSPPLQKLLKKPLS